MYSAVSEKNLKFNLIHEKDGGRIGYQQYCKLEDEVVSRDEIVKAYEVDDDEFVYLHDEDFQAAAPESYKTITIQDFVPAEEIDPIYFERTYYLGPADRSGEPVYALLVRAMEEAGLVAVATYVFHDRENLGCLRVRDGVLTLEKMFFADEVRPAEGIAPEDIAVEDRQLEMAMQLIRQYEGRFDPEKYHDEYRERLLGVIEAKRSGEGVKAAPTPEKTTTPDLLAALQASLDEAKKERPEAAPAKAKAKGGSRKKATAGAGGGGAAAPRRRRSG
jgi:DNA end-binding protein Ku